MQRVHAGRAWQRWGCLGPRKEGGGLVVGRPLQAPSGRGVKTRGNLWDRASWVGGAATCVHASARGCVGACLQKHTLHPRTVTQERRGPSRAAAPATSRLLGSTQAASSRQHTALCASSTRAATRRRASATATTCGAVTAAGSTTQPSSRTCAATRPRSGRRGRWPRTAQPAVGVQRRARAWAAAKLEHETTPSKLAGVVNMELLGGVGLEGAGHATRKRTRMQPPSRHLGHSALAGRVVGVAAGGWVRSAWRVLFVKADGGGQNNPWATVRVTGRTVPAFASRPAHAPA